MSSTGAREILDSVDRAFRRRRGDLVVIATSAGADSTALSVAAAEYAGRSPRIERGAFVLAHFDHALRDPEEHARERASVTLLAERLGLALFCGSAVPGAYRTPRRHGGTESLARHLRYGFLHRVCSVSGARTLWTAHHQDDQVETVAMRLLQSERVSPLRGIPSRRVEATLTVDRPLLDVRRDSLRAYLEREGFDWIEDRSNSNPEFRRNFVRHVVLPSLSHAWPAWRTDLLSLQRAAMAHETRVSDSASRISAQLFDGVTRIDAAGFYRASEEVRLHLIYQILSVAGLIHRSDRPGHRFFAPLLGPRPNSRRVILEGRGLRFGYTGRYIEVRPIVVAFGDCRYLR